MKDKHKLFNNGFDNAHNRMIKFTSIEEVNEKKLMDYIKEAVKLNATEKKTVVTELEIPDDLKKWFLKNKKEKKFFETLAHTFKKEMIHHIINAKQEETKKRRFVQVTTALKKAKSDFRAY